MTNEQQQGWRKGTVEKIALTFGGPGNQWTTIDGTQYATFWNWNVYMPKEGDTVLYREYMRPFWHGQPALLHAEVKPYVEAGAA